MDPNWQEHLAGDAWLSRADASRRRLSAGSEHGQADDLGSGTAETGTSGPRAFAALRSRARPQLITEEDGGELPVPALDSDPGNDGEPHSVMAGHTSACKCTQYHETMLVLAAESDVHNQDSPGLSAALLALESRSPSASGAMPNAAVEASGSCEGLSGDQFEFEPNDAQHSSGIQEAAEAVAATDSSMNMPHSTQLSTRDAVLLEITQMRADLEHHAARRASLHAETDAAGTMASVGRVAVPSQASLPASGQMQRDGRPEQDAGSDPDSMSLTESQPLPCAAPQQQALEATPNLPVSGERSEKAQGSGRRASWSEPDEQGHGFALQWAQLPPPPRRLSTQPSSPLPLARSSSLPNQFGPAVPHTPISWALPPLHQQPAAPSTSQRSLQWNSRRLTGHGRSGLPPIKSAPPCGNPGTNSLSHPEQDVQIWEAKPALAPVAQAAAGQGQSMPILRPLRVPSPRGQQIYGMPGAASVGHCQRPRLRSDPGVGARQQPLCHDSVMHNCPGTSCVRVSGQDR